MDHPMKSTKRSLTSALLFVACWCGYFAALPTHCQAATVGFDWDLVASDLHPTLKYFPAATSANVFTTGPFQNLHGGIGTATSIMGMPTLLDSFGGNASNLTFEFGNFSLPLPGSPTPAMPLEAESFVNGDSTGVAVQTYLPGAMPNFDNTLIVKNAGSPIAQGRVTRVVIETVIAGSPNPIPGSPGFFVLNLHSTGYAEFELDTAVGPDTIFFDTLLELSNGTIEGYVHLDVFGNAGSGDDPALFTSAGKLPIFTADFDIDGRVDGHDFLIWQRGFGQSATQATGDANEDGLNNTIDLAIWQLQYEAGAASALSSQIAVPEPTSTVLAAFVLMAGALLRTSVGKQK